MREYINDFWNVFGYIYNSTKELYILAEEYDDELSSFIQPIKEQKDSLEHIVRAYMKLYSNEDITENFDEDYVKQNLSKAMGHVFRAFFDTADILSIILREKISSHLKLFTYAKIVEVWPKYEDVRKRLIDMPKLFAEFRFKKDIAKNSNETRKMVEDYVDRLKELLNIYEEFMKNVYPKLNV